MDLSLFSLYLPGVTGPVSKYSGTLNPERKSPVTMATTSLVTTTVTASVKHVKGNL